jgi:hypothetical protein
MAHCGPERPASLIALPEWHVDPDGLHSETVALTAGHFQAALLRALRLDHEESAPAPLHAGACQHRSVGPRGNRDANNQSIVRHVHLDQEATHLQEEVHPLRQGPPGRAISVGEIGQPHQWDYLSPPKCSLRTVVMRAW